MVTPLIGPLTSRLVLRHLWESDRQPFADLNADPLVMEHLQALLTRDESDTMMDRCIEQFACDGYGLWAVEVRISGELIGFVGLAAPTWEAAFTPCTENGWRLARSAWGYGYATEVANAALGNGLSYSSTLLPDPSGHRKGPPTSARVAQ